MNYVCKLVCVTEIHLLGCVCQIEAGRIDDCIPYLPTLILYRLTGVLWSLGPAPLISGTIGGAGSVNCRVTGSVTGFSGVLQHEMSCTYCMQLSNNVVTL